MKIIFSLLLMVSFLVLADTYHNCGTTEPAFNIPSSHIVMCDDFEDGSWAPRVDGNATAANDGWFMRDSGGQYDGSGDATDPFGTDYGRCGGRGASGTNCTSTTHRQNTPAVGTNGATGHHYFYPDGHINSQYKELYVRFYTRQRSAAFAEAGVGDFVMGHEKTVNMTAEDSNWLMFVGHKHFGNGSWAFISQNEDQFVGQNQGDPPGILLYDDDPVTGNLDHWFYVEHRIRLDDAGQNNGLYQMWLNDCGVSGLDCTQPGSGTLRINITGRNFLQDGTGQPDSDRMDSMWIESWGNASSQGTQEYDQWVISTERIGQMANFGTPFPPDRKSTVGIFFGQ